MIILYKQTTTDWEVLKSQGSNPHTNAKMVCVFLVDPLQQLSSHTVTAPQSPGWTPSPTNHRCVARSPAVACIKLRKNQSCWFISANLLSLHMFLREVRKIPRNAGYLEKYLWAVGDGMRANSWM